jgi:hypothetical protein
VGGAPLNLRAAAADFLPGGLVVSAQPVEAEIGPLHRLAHAQLLVAAEREGWIGDAVAAALGPDAQLMLEASRSEHPLEVDEDLGRLVGGRDAHEVLADLIAACHRREGASYAALLAVGGDEAEVRLRLVAWDHGAEVGRRTAAAAKAGAGPAVALDLLCDTMLEDLPCRGSMTLLAQEPKRIAWRHDRCPYQVAWEAAGAPHALGCSVISAWIRGFASGVDPNVEYRRPRAIARGDASCEHELIVIG